MARPDNHHRVSASGERPKRARVTPRTLGRRGVLAAVGTGLIGSLAGCFGEPSFPDADVVAGPDERLVFDPPELTVSVGETVIWGFASGGHNVCCRPEDATEVALPDGAEPFASYGPNEPPQGSLVPRGETFEHTFDVAGEYVYVCIPHVEAGMMGTIHVE